MTYTLTPRKNSLSDKGTLYLNLLRKEFANGGIEIYDFQLESVKHDSLSPLNRKQFVRGLITSEEFKKHTLPLWQGPLPKGVKLELKENNIYHFLFVLCSSLQYGGAYSPIGQSSAPKEVVSLSTTFFLDFLDDPLNYYYYNSYKAWTSWHYNVAWDYTAVFLSKDMTRLKMFLTTDTD